MARREGDEELMDMKNNFHHSEIFNTYIALFL